MKVRPLELILCCSDPKRNYLCCFCSVTNLKEKDERERGLSSDFAEFCF